jgi:hypothetical protein
VTESGFGADGRSALYPPGPAGGAPGSASTAWFSTLRTVLEQLGAQNRRAETRSEPDLTDTLDMSATVSLEGDAVGGRAGERRVLLDRLRARSPEAADVPADRLDELLATHRAQISSLADSFGLDRATLLTALGRGLVPGELDPVVASAVAAGVPELLGVIGSGSVAVERDGRGTTLIAAATVDAPTGPVRLTGEHWERRGLTDVWLCAVPADPDPLGTAQNLFERILPQIGVLRAHLRTSERRRLHIGIQAVAPDADPELVMGRLAGWRSAVGQLSAGFVQIIWEQA